MQIFFVLFAVLVSESGLSLAFSERHDAPPFTDDVGSGYVKRTDCPHTAVSLANQLVRLQTSIQVLLEPDYFLPGSGFPTASEWTSTVLATLLIDYAQAANDSQYFSDFIAVFNNESVIELAFQGNDDKLWVCLACLRGAAYASINFPQWVQTLLSRAKLFYTLASTGWDNTTCGGGIVSGPFSAYKNAVTNELWITASVGMYEAFGEPSMLEAALQGWTWFKNSGMINAQGLVNDGLSSNCTNNGLPTWTYNQGIVLSGLSKLYNYTGDASFLQAAENLIDSVLVSPLVNSSVLVESCDPSLTCDEDQWMFKGVFMKHLGYFLADIVESPLMDLCSKHRLVRKYDEFIQANAQAVWDVARAPDGKIGNWWTAPPGDQSQLQFSVETTGSGVAALWGAVHVDQLLQSLAPCSGD